MSVVHQLVGPRSKYNRKLPYTYMAKVCEIEGQPDLDLHYYADTICGLIEYLAEYGIEPERVELFGMYLDRTMAIEKRYCISEGGNWLRRPDICQSLEEHYRKTMEQQYRGHAAFTPCAYEDRDRKGSGPFG